MHRFLPTCLVFLITGIAWAGQTPQLNVLTSVYPLVLIVRELGGERVAVDTLVAPGASPHTFEPVPSDMAKLNKAHFFIRVGGGLDSWSGKLLGAAPRSIETVTLIEARDLRPLKNHDLAASHHPHHHTAKAGQGSDPHLWLDPIRVRDVVGPLVTARLVQGDPAGKAYYEQRAREFRKRLTALHGAIRLEIGRAKARKYVAFHNTWRYFAERYGLEQVAVVQEFAGEEPTPRELANLVQAARRAGISDILVEPQLNPRIAKIIATEFGGGTVVVDPLGDPFDPARSTYEKLMLFNARAFSRALRGTRN